MLKEVSEICVELERLSVLHPDLTVQEIIEVASDRHFSTRNVVMYPHIGKRKLRTWKLSNTDILKALRAYT